MIIFRLCPLGGNRICAEAGAAIVVGYDLSAGRPSLGELLTGRRAGGYGNPEFMTPRSTTSIPSAQNNWLGGLEVPRWVTRLGSYLSVGHAELAPSPLLGSPSTPTPPPGGQAFRLRSAEPYYEIFTTPAYTSKFFGYSTGKQYRRKYKDNWGIYLPGCSQLKKQNHRLRAELDETQRTLEESRREVVDSQQRPGPAMGIFGDIQGTQVEAVQSQSIPSMIPTSLTSQRLFQAPGLSMGPSVSQGFGVQRGANVLPEEGLPGGDRYSGRAGEFPNMGASEPPGTTTATIPPMAPAPPPVPEQRGFLRSFLGTGRSRGDTPPPPKTPATAAQESPMMDALMKGVQQLQELQAAAMAKGQSLAAEVVKPGTTSLTSLPAVSQGAETALLFQDWLEVTSSVMRDVSEQLKWIMVGSGATGGGKSLQGVVSGYPTGAAKRVSRRKGTFRRTLDKAECSCGIYASFGYDSGAKGRYGGT